MTFPRKVNLYEVGPRDGLQNEKEIIPIDVKVNLINKLINHQHNNYKYLDEIVMNDFLVSAVSFLT